ncbi:hypothetical protein NESM_000714000 [Novymonas esmeraldas]|uniref:Uncharacterized protein n=1 Tax=Novymonas esmeraldas TaxID=1808958 RepID=A0AAW0EX10_9TRYP
MSDVLAYLRGVVHRVSATFMPAEMDHVACFLRGEAWVAAAGGTAAATSLCFPLGATRWGRFIPLGIASADLIAAATSGSRAVLLQLLESKGLSPVLAVNLVPTEQQQQQQRQETGRHADPAGDDRLGPHTGEAAAARKRRRMSASTSAAAVAVDAALDGRYGTTAEAARHGCMAAVRRWFAEVEEEAAEAAEAAAPAASELRGAPRLGRQRRVRRLLLLVRCCADNRVAVSTRGARAGASSAPHAASAAGRRHRGGADPLHLLLHDLAAVTTLYEVRLAATGTTARPAVLLLPEDDSYAGALLKQQLRDEVGYRYWIELLLQLDSADGDTHRGEGWRATLVSGPGGGGGGLAGASRRQRPQTPAETPLERGCRLAEQWGLLDVHAPTAAVAGGGGGDDDDASPGAPRPPRGWSRRQRETALRRDSSCFFLRPSNAALCVFLMEALRRFPVLVRPAVLRHWQSTWTARHVLSDVLLAVHTALCPFAVSAASARGDTVPPPAPGADPSQGASASPPSSTAAAAATAAQDTAELLDALLDASFTLAEERDAVQPLSANDFTIEQATHYLLLYDALVCQRESRLRRIPGVVRVLARLSERGSRAAADDPVRVAVRSRLPFAPLNQFYDGVVRLAEAGAGQRGGVREVRSYPMDALTLPLRRVSVAPQLQHGTLLALLPPGESLVELQEVAERAWRAVADAACSGEGSGTGERDDGNDAALSLLRRNNFYHPRVPHALRVLYILTAHALHAPTEAARHVPVVQLQAVCQLSDEQLLRVLAELQVCGLASVNAKRQTACTLLDSA